MKKTEKPTKTPIDVEEIPEGESAWREEIASITMKFQEKRKSLQDGEVLRGAHPESHGCVDAYFIVDEDIRGNYRVGLFAQPGRRYEAKIRYSNADVAVERDLDKMGENGISSLLTRAVPDQYVTTLSTGISRT